MERSSSAFGSTEEIFFGGASAADFEYMAEAAGNDAAVSAYLGDPSSITAASRRRIVRRPIGSNYQASSIIFSERDRDGASPAFGSEPLSELLQQLAASRKGSARPTSAAARDAAGMSSSLLSSLTNLTAIASEGSKRGSSEDAAAATPAQQIRACFVQELMLSTLSDPLDASGPLYTPHSK